MALPRRRAKGTAPDAAHLYVQIAPAAKAVVDRIHESTGAPRWVVVEQILGRIADDLDERGVPVWWPEQPDQQEELPLKTA